ncbi:MAG: hypothetical protein M5U14_05350 [Acidimicrobiia bacterium]|nr:hypothetical protein [Acidimicrobiia bacterium]
MNDLVECEHRSPRRLLRRLAAVLLVLGVAALIGGCGDDDDGDGGGDEEAFCAAGEALRSDVRALTELDVIAEGTSGLRAAVDEVVEDLEDLMAAGREIAGEEIEELDAAVDDLGSAIDAIADEGISSGNAGDVVDAVERIGPAAEALYTTLAETCP